MTILGPDGRPAEPASGLLITADISGKPRTVELMKMNRKTCWVRVGGIRPGIVKRHLDKHHVRA